MAGLGDRTVAGVTMFPITLAAGVEGSIPEATAPDEAKSRSFDFSVDPTGDERFFFPSPLRRRKALLGIPTQFLLACELSCLPSQTRIIF